MCTADRMHAILGGAPSVPISMAMALWGLGLLDALMLRCYCYRRTFLLPVVRRWSFRTSACSYSCVTTDWCYNNTVAVGGGGVERATAHAIHNNAIK